MRKEGKKSLITFGNAKITKGKKKKNKSFFSVVIIIIIENSIIEKNPKNDKPGYANIGESIEISAQEKLNRYNNMIEVEAIPFNNKLFIFLSQRFN